MALVLDWRKKLGYSMDPFEGIMLPASKHMVGLHDIQERLNLFLIKEERFGTIAGEHGTGKTLLLQWMNEELAPQKSHLQHLLDGRMKCDEIVNTLLAPRLSFIERKLGGKLKLPEHEKEKELLQRLAKENKNVLLIDNAGSLGKHELELLADIGVKTPTYIIISDTEERLKKLVLPEALSDKLKLKIPTLACEQLTELLQRRIGSVGGKGTFPFNEEELSGLIKKADRNPAKLLGLCRERAIELSLKASAPAAAPQVKSTSFFSIKVEKVSADKKQQSSGQSAESRDQLHELHREVKLPPAAREEGDLLAKVVEALPESAQRQSSVVKAPAPEEVIVADERKTQAQRKTNADKAVSKVVGHLAEEFSKRPKAQAKSKAKSRSRA